MDLLGAAWEADEPPPWPAIVELTEHRSVSLSAADLNHEALGEIRRLLAGADLSGPDISPVEVVAVVRELLVMLRLVEATR